MPCPILAAIAVLPGQRPGAERSSKQPSITRSIIPICNDRRSSSSRGRMTCLRAIFHVSLPACDPFSHCRRFVFGLQDGSAEASMMPLSCRLPPATAMLDRNRSYSSQISLDQGISACRRLHRVPRELTEILLVTDQPRSRHTAHVVVSTVPRELTEILPSTGNATAQPGRRWLCRREALLPLARSYRMK